MRSLLKSAFWLISLKPLVQLNFFLCLDNKFCAIFHPFTWIWLYFSPISGKFLPYGQNLNFWLKFCFDFYIFILIYILWTVIDIWESSTHWVYLNQEKNNIWTVCLSLIQLYIYSRMVQNCRLRFRRIVVCVFAGKLFVSKCSCDPAQQAFWAASK